MYVIREDDRSSEYITQQFDANPILYMAGSEVAARTLLVNGRDLVERFHFIEPPKSRIGDLLASNSGYAGKGLAPASDEFLADVDPGWGQVGSV
jgi:hypothetical protein